MYTTYLPDAKKFLKVFVDKKSIWYIWHYFIGNECQILKMPDLSQLNFLSFPFLSV